MCEQGERHSEIGQQEPEAEIASSGRRRGFCQERTSGEELPVALVLPATTARRVYIYMRAPIGGTRGLLPPGWHPSRSAAPIECIARELAPLSKRRSSGALRPRDGLDAENGPHNGMLLATAARMGLRSEGTVRARTLTCCLIGNAAVASRWMSDRLHSRACLLTRLAEHAPTCVNLTE